MQDQSDITGNEYIKIAESVRSGEYFRKSRAMYDLFVHDLIAERYLYVAITFMAVLVFITVTMAMDSLYPLSTPVPFIFNVTNVVDDVPRMRSLAAFRGEDPSQALLRFFAKNYVAMREEYKIDTFERNRNGVQSQSSPGMFAQYQRETDPRNPQSPVTLYQRHSIRLITIESARFVERTGEMEVTYQADVEGKGEIKKSRWQANIAFQYTGIALDENTGKVKPVRFIVTQYRTKRLQDIE